MDYFNEIRLILILYHILSFTALVPDAEVKYIMGYSCSTVLVLGIATNLILLVSSSVTAIKRKCRLRAAKKTLKKQK